MIEAIIKKRLGVIIAIITPVKHLPSKFIILSSIARLAEDKMCLPLINTSHNIPFLKKYASLTSFIVNILSKEMLLKGNL